jgi:ATP-dependent Lon protease
MTRTLLPATLESRDPSSGQGGGDVQPSGSAVADVHVPEDALIIVPVRNLVLFPGLIVPVAIGRERSIAAAQYAVRHERPVGILLQDHAEVETPGLQDMARVGTQASILRYVSTPDGNHHLICQGQERFRVIDLPDGYPFMVARVERIDTVVPAGDAQSEALFLRLKERAIEVLGLLPQTPQEIVHAVQTIESAQNLTDLVAGYLDIKPAEKQELLEEADLRLRMERLLALMARRIEVMQLSREIDQRTKSSMGQREREFLLREQMKAIQKELGEDGADNVAEVAELRKAIGDAGMPPEAHKQAEKEVKRLERMSDASAEYSMVRTYLDWMVELPWRAPQPDVIDVAQARTVLDADHFGLEKVKERILEFLAVRKLKPDGHSPILCLVGPPGVGKTSLGQSIARALGRPFVRVSLGGVHDEAEIRGHRRTYIGALPGNIIQALKKAGTRGCVMMLDEIDKMGSGIQGDPSAALLEVLDPQQNHTFRDNYLAVPFDLSQVVFIATANMLDPVAGPLRDRMEVLQLSGYTRDEKRTIARKYLIARQIDASGLNDTQFAITDAAIDAIIRDYTREAGVRNLERQIGAVCRRAAVRIAQGQVTQVSMDVQDLADVLGPIAFENDVALRVGMPGVATGLAWTPVGGDILFIEASRTPGSGRLILTGQLGDVMKESAQAALTLVKARAPTLGLDASVFDKADVHVHVPAGAIPKDGPSAGVAMYVAMASLFCDRPVHSDTAMTGEISLRGLVLPVGGIKDKVLAALAAGIRRVMLPARNRKDLVDLPKEARELLEFVFLEDVTQAMEVAVGQLPQLPQLASQP